MTARRGKKFGAAIKIVPGRALKVRGSPFFAAQNASVPRPFRKRRLFGVAVLPGKKPVRTRRLKEVGRTVRSPALQDPAAGLRSPFAARGKTCQSFRDAAFSPRAAVRNSARRAAPRGQGDRKAPLPTFNKSAARHQCSAFVQTGQAAPQKNSRRLTLPAAVRVSARSCSFFAAVWGRPQRGPQVFLTKSCPQRGQVMAIMPLPRGTRHFWPQLGHLKQRLPPWEPPPKCG